MYSNTYYAMYQKYEFPTEPVWDLKFTHESGPLPVGIAFSTTPSDLVLITFVFCSERPSCELNTAQMCIKKTRKAMECYRKRWGQITAFS